MKSDNDKKRRMVALERLKNIFHVRKYRLYRLVVVLTIFELPAMIATLALFSIANPNLYRTKLWKDGAMNGFNSDPSEIVYSYANYKPIKTPLVWSQFTTTWNLVISVLATFMMITKWFLLAAKLFRPWISVLSHSALTALFIVAIHNQAAPDNSDSDHRQPGAPWYLTKSCSVVYYKSNYHYCQQAKGVFALTCILSIVYFTYVVNGVYSLMFPLDLAPEDKEADFEDPQFELKNYVPPTPGTTGGIKSPMAGGTIDGMPAASIRSPITPRTMAYNTLGGGGVSAGYMPRFDPPPTAAKKTGKFRSIMRNLKV